MILSELIYKCFNESAKRGWWDTDTLETPAVKIALIHSEISEALEGLRKNKMDDHLPHRKSVEVELADAIIRICDLAGRLRLDLEGAIIEKMEYNAKREDHNRDVRNSEGGKKF